MYFILGKDTGLVTTTRVTHATPAALFGRTPSRDWEVDSRMPDNATRCKDLARQLIEDLPGRDLKVSHVQLKHFFQIQVF